LRREEGELNPEDRAWFEPLVERVGPDALKFAYMQVRNLELAQDIVQEAFAKVWASPRTPHGRVEFKRWLYRSIANLVKDEHRHEQRLAEFVTTASAPAAMDEFERWLSHEVTATAIQRLPLRDRQLIYLHYFEDHPLLECARLLGLHPVSVRVQVRRALGRLRRELASMDPLLEVASDVP